MEDTLVILKPDGVNKKILFEVIRRFEENNLIVSNLKGVELDKELLKEHYKHLINRSFYKELEDFMLSSIVVVMIVSGLDAVSKVRGIVGATDPNKAEVGTIRYDYGNREIMCKNVIHASDSIENALIEIKRFYNNDNELIDKKEKIYQKKR